MAPIGGRAVIDDWGDVVMVLDEPGGGVGGVGDVRKPGVETADEPPPLPVVVGTDTIDTDLALGRPTPPPPPEADARGELETFAT